jgi:hypothetical protein
MSGNESFSVRVLGGQLSGVLVGGGYALVFTVISQVVLVCVLKRFHENSLTSSLDADFFGGRRR